MSVNYIRLFLISYEMEAFIQLSRVFLLLNTERDGLKNVTKPAVAKKGMSENFSRSLGIIYKYIVFICNFMNALISWAIKTIQTKIRSAFL